MPTCLFQLKANWKSPLDPKDIFACSLVQNGNVVIGWALWVKGLKVPNMEGINKEGLFVA